jgi:hypothetical protein
MATNYSNLHLRLSPLPLSQETSLIPLLFLKEVLSDVKETVTPPLIPYTSPRQNIRHTHVVLFHIFPEDRQLQPAKFVSSLLSPEKGSGMPVRNDVVYDGLNMFCHSPESWMQMWVEDVFGGEDKDGNDRVKVETELIIRVDVRVDNSDEDVWHLKWSVTRL